jgi:hypothetical protein
MNSRQNWNVNKVNNFARIRRCRVPISKALEEIVNKVYMTTKFTFDGMQIGKPLWDALNGC